MSFREQSTLRNRAFICTTNDVSSGSNIENRMVLIRNPADSGRVMKIYRITTGTNVSSNNNIFRFYINPAVTTAGTLLTSVCMNIQANPVSSQMEISKLPTTSTNGTMFLNLIQGPTSSDSLDFPHMIMVHPGSAILVTVRPNAASGVTHSFNIFYLEE